MPTNEDSFLEAFREMNAAADRHTCACGHEYYHEAAMDDTDRTTLEDDANATPLEYAVSFVQFGAKLYVEQCTCWHEHARKVIAFLDHYALQISCYQGLERLRKQTTDDIG